MKDSLRTMCSAIIIVEGLAILWLAKAIDNEPGIDSFSDGVRAFFTTMTSSWF